MTNADIYRKNIINKLLKNKVINNRVSLFNEGDTFYYSEILPLTEIIKVKKQKTLYNFLFEFTNKRLNKVLNDNNLFLDYDKIDITSSDFYDGYELKVPLKPPLKESKKLILENTHHLDDDLSDLYEMLDKIDGENVDVSDGESSELTTFRKNQDPSKVDRVLKYVARSEFSDHKINSDAGTWKVSDIKNEGDKLLIIFKNDNHNDVIIELLFFPDDSNKIKVSVKHKSGEVLIRNFIEVYRIPTNSYVAKIFFRKTVFNLLKKFIDDKVIRLKPFSDEFVFWKTDNPNFSYSFSSPKKNKIISNLIQFVNFMNKPILDDFFEQHNLKHKQGYLQNLLDASEAAGIFKYKREGNEIIIHSGVNYKAFLNGKLRRVG